MRNVWTDKIEKRKEWKCYFEESKKMRFEMKRGTGEKNSEKLKAISWDSQESGLSMRNSFENKMLASQRTAKNNGRKNTARYVRAALC